MFPPVEKPLATVEHVRYFLRFVELDRALTDEEIRWVLLRMTAHWEAMIRVPMGRRTNVKGRVDGVDGWELKLPYRPIKSLETVVVYVGTGWLSWRFEGDQIVFVDRDPTLEGMSPTRQLFVNRLTGRMVVPIGWILISPDATMSPALVAATPVHHLTITKRFFSGPLNVAFVGTFGYDLDDEEPIMHPPVDVQEAVALLAAIDIATLASTIAGGLSSWHLGQRTENYAGGAKYAWAIEQWRKRVEEIANRYFSWVQKVDV